MATPLGEGRIRLGLNVPLFIASIISIGVGTLVGMVGIWWYLAWKQPVPFWQKVSHAHAAWWSALILLAAMLLPGLTLKPWVKKAIVVGTFLGPTFWVGTLGAYYELGGPALWRFQLRGLVGSYYDIPLLGLGAAILEFLGFLALGIVGISASGIKIPFISSERPPPKSRLELVTDVEVPRSIFLLPTLTIIFGVLAGFFITSAYKMAKLPISPAALVQLHDHPALLATSSIILLLLISLFGGGERTFRLAYTLVALSLPLTIVGLLAFTLAGLPSIVWVAPAGLYYLIIPMALLLVLGILRGSSMLREYINPLKAAIAVCLVGIIILIAQGAVLALLWSTSPNVTVTYKQPEGVPYPGPYPSTFLGTAPVRGTPRGLENAHLSPGSWFHIALVWLILLIVVGEKLFKDLLKKPGLAYLFLITIPAAPLFNMAGRYLAWLGVPNGIGALYFAGHPLKGFNIIGLFIVGLLALYLLSRGRMGEPSDIQGRRA